jgi:glycosyltransferase involved in cell wall biosynthesis
VLVHHVHREQWPVVYPGLGGRVGWFLESRVAPRLYRGTQYVAVSRSTREELRAVGVPGSHVALVHNGTEPVLRVQARKSERPTICVVGRLVPHKQVEHAIDAAVHLRERHPGLRLHVVGSGWWEPELRAYAAERAAGATVVFEGHVDERRKQELYEQAWVLALPSLKEGWGLVVGEAAMHGTPTVAYRSAGGTRESIRDGVSGILADDRTQFTDALDRILTDPAWRARLSAGARAHGEMFTWAHSQEAFAHVAAAAIRGEMVGGEDETG